MEEQNDIEILRFYLKKIRIFGFRLRLMSLIISIILVSDIIVLAIFANSLKAIKYEPYAEFYYSVDFYFTLLVLSILGVTLLFIFHILRKQGMTYYEEVTDELAWGKNREEYQQRPPIEFRVNIKEFIKSTDLPFTSGANGQALYLSFFLLIITVAISIQIIYY